MLNTYLYPDNNPTSRKDPLGLHKQPPSPPPCEGAGGGGGLSRRKIATAMVIAGSLGLVAFDVGIAIAYGITSLTGISIAGGLLIVAAIYAYTGIGNC
jgi:hypothetical protein